jgi:hypothetical protein
VINDDPSTTEFGLRGRPDSAHGHLHRLCINMFDKNARLRSDNFVTVRIALSAQWCTRPVVLATFEHSGCEEDGGSGDRPLPLPLPTAGGGTGRLGCQKHCISVTFGGTLPGKCWRRYSGGTNRRHSEIGENLTGTVDFVVESDVNLGLEASNRLSEIASFGALTG